MVAFDFVFRLFKVKMKHPVLIRRRFKFTLNVENSIQPIAQGKITGFVINNFLGTYAL